MNKTCEMHMGEDGNYYMCGKPAKFMSQKSGCGRAMYLCGIHKNSVDAIHKRNGMVEKCFPITINRE